MIEKDLIFRQINQLIRVLAHALHLKQMGRLREAQEEIGDGLFETFGRRIAEILEMQDAALLELCSPEGKLNGELVLALAELIEQQGLLAEEAVDQETTAKCYSRALVLYEALLSSGGTMPLDIHDRIEWLYSKTKS